MDRAKTYTEAEIGTYGLNCKISVSLGTNSTVVQAEILAIEQCV